MWFKLAVLFYVVVRVVLGQPGRCDQTPVGALSPASNGFHSPYYLEIKTTVDKFLPGQTYVLVLATKDTSRPFKEFMITVEDPSVDNNIYNFNHRNVDVGTLKTLDDDLKTQYSERCYSSVENKDISDKLHIEMHWVSPKQAPKGQRVRFRAMVAENKEVWYTGGQLNLTMEKDDQTPADSPPYEVIQECSVCSEARYEVVFSGKWSRGTHSLHYPSNPDRIKFSRMVGASHDENYVLWKQNVGASEGLRMLAERADISGVEAEIIENMKQSTRTLIRGKMRQYPHMSDPSHALFRVDRKHHMFSLVVAMKPSPDWFLGTSSYELCHENGSWLNYYEMPLYPWDAGTMDGVSYESPTSVTTPWDSVDRVAVGSFDKASPFYQMNLNDLKPFAMLEVRKLDEYPLPEDTCENDANDQPENEVDENSSESQDDPLVAESKVEDDCPEEPAAWSPCLPDDGQCGLGMQTRIRYRKTPNQSLKSAEGQRSRPVASCQERKETQDCFVEC